MFHLAVSIAPRVRVCHRHGFLSVRSFTSLRTDVGILQSGPGPSDHRGCCDARRLRTLSERSSTRFYSLFSLRSGKLIQGFLMQDPNLSQVSLRFFNVALYGVQLFPDCKLTSMIQRGFKAIDAKCSTSGKGISLLYFVAG